ncbi:MAG: DUF502 domain-containing protein [Verrucomicrobiota bacterium]
MNEQKSQPTRASKKPGIETLAYWRNKFLAGLFVLLPLLATIWVLRFLYKIFSGTMEPLVAGFVTANHESIADIFLSPGPREGTYTIHGLALFITVCIIFAIGFLVTNVFGRRIVQYCESVLERIPLVNIIYSLVKQVMDSVKSISESADRLEESDNREVVYVRYPGVNGYLIGFQTGKFQNKKGEDMVSVFIPTAPNPITGFVLVFEARQVIESDLTMESAWKLLVSAGFVTPKQSVSFQGANSPASTAIPTIPIPESDDTRQTV